MNQQCHFTTEEREKAMILKAQGETNAEIARQLGRHRSSVGREFARNSKKNGEYSSNHADKTSRQRKRHCGRKPLLSNEELKTYVIERMFLRWTPEQIAGRAKLESYPIAFSYNAIYRAINNRLIPIELRKLMRFRWQRKGKKGGDGRSKIANTVSIHERPESANKRIEVGHWESDTVLGQRKTGCIGTHVERKTGYLLAFYLEHRRDELFAKKTEQAFEKLPAVLKKSFTVDNGTEFMNHENLAKSTKMNVFFCDPFSPWQRGTNENTNGLLRQFYPKRTSFADITDVQLQTIVELINNRPRKRFGFKTPNEILALELKNCCV